MKNTELLKNIPAELKWNAVWCCWKLTAKGKIPFNPQNGQCSKSNDKNTFVSYPILLNYIDEYEGVGIGVFNDYSAIDIDDCIIDGRLSEMAQDIVNYCNSYTEYSPSGKGIRIIFKTNTVLDKDKYYVHNMKNGLEIYLSGQTNKFVSITGNTLGINGEIVNVDITDILNKYMLRYSDLDNALSKDKKLNELWNSVATGFGGNESETDLALCDKLAFYLKGDYNAIEDAFVKSPYFASKDEEHKKKWMRLDYRKNVINKAIMSVNSPVQTIKNTNKYTLTDTGNAHRFIDEFGSNLKYNVDNKKWMIWNGKYWQTDITNEVRNKIEILAEQLKMEIFSCEDDAQRKIMSQNYNHILNKAGKDNLLNEASAIEGVCVLNSDFDKQPNLLNCENGVVDLKTGEIKESTKDLMLGMNTHIVADLENEPTQFLKFLDDIFEDNKDLIRYIQKWLGYACSGDTREQKMALWYGDGSNGKSLLLKLAITALGDYAEIARSDLLTEQFNKNNTLGQIAMLKGKRLVWVGELNPGERADEKTIKSLTSGLDKITGKFLYANEFSFIFIGKLIMPSNYLLTIKGTDKGIWRRIDTVPFNQTYEGANNDKDLEEKLMKELPQILGWMIKGYRLYCEEGLNAPEIVIKTNTDYKQEMDIVANWIAECCDTTDVNAVSKASELYQEFVRWCKNNNQYVISNNLFGRNLSKKHTRKQLSSCKVYFGIKIRSNVVISERDIEYNRIDVSEDI